MSIFNLARVALDRNPGEDMMLIARNPLPSSPIEAPEDELGRMKDV